VQVLRQIWQMVFVAGSLMLVLAGRRLWREQKAAEAITR
jgi:hypothetical protein